MTRFWRGSLLIVEVEAALVGLLLVAPGAGHSPLFNTQLPALMVVARIDIIVGSCIPCERNTWALGIAAKWR